MPEDMPEKKLSQFGQLLEDQNLSQAQVARDFDLSRYYVWQLCWGLQPAGPSRMLRKRIAEWAWKNYKTKIDPEKWPEPEALRAATTTARSPRRPTRRSAASGSVRPPR